MGKKPKPKFVQQTTPPPVLPRSRTVAMTAICAALAIVTLAAFWALLSSGFINYDDTEYVTENARVQKGLTGESVAWAFLSTAVSNWHPLTWISHMLDVQLFGLDAGMHHLTSILLHIVNAVLLFLLLFRMTGALWRSAFVAGLFALHPLHVESVAWISERKDVLSTLFWLLTTGAWLHYVKSKRAGAYALALVFYSLGLMAKPMLVTLPFTLLLLDYWPLRRLSLPLRGRSGALKELLWEKAPLFALMVASCVITVVAQRGAGAVQTLAQSSMADRMVNAVRAYGAYLGKMCWPSSLSVFYPPLQAGAGAGGAAAAFLVLAMGTVLAYRWRHKAPYAAFGWLWYVGTLVPVIGLVQVGEQAMADRYTYVPLIGIFIALAWAAGDAVKKNPALRQGVAIAAGLVLAALFVSTRIQAGHWRDSKTLFEHALAVTADNYLAHNQIGGPLGAEGRLAEAADHYRQALRIRPGFAHAHHNLGVILAGWGRLDEAAEHYRRALQLKPDYVQAMDNLGVVLGKMNRMAEAVPYLKEAVRIKPDFADAQYNLGLALDGAGRLDEAMEHYRQALRLKPDFVDAMNAMGLALGKMDRLPEAIECLQNAVRMHPDSAEAHYNLGLALDDSGRLDEAVEHYRRAIRIKPDHVQAMSNLGVALGKMNRLPEAIECLQNAVRINPDFADAQYNLGLALGYAGRLDEAAEHYRQALRINPVYAEARAGLQNVQNALRSRR